MFTLLIVILSIGGIGLLIWALTVGYQAVQNGKNHSAIEAERDRVEERLNIAQAGLREIIVNPESAITLALTTLDEINQKELTRRNK